MVVKKIPKKTITVIEPKSSMIVDKEKYKQKRVAAYCRVSTDSEEQLTSYKTQKKVYTQMIAAKPEWCFAGMYADEGISGTRADKRPQFQKMINDCLNGEIDYIITKSVSRFARNTVECLEYVRMLKNRDIGIYFEEQGIDTLKSDSELYLVIYAGFAQSESESMSKNVTWSFRKNFEDGKVVFNYKKMVGYKKGDDGKPEIVPEEAEIVKSIYEMFLAGWTPKMITEKLHSDGIETKCGKQKWSVATIQNILRNEKYCGDAILQKTVTIDCISKTIRKNTGEAPMYYVHNNHEPIVSREIFNRVQEELALRNNRSPISSKNTVTAQGKYTKYALSDIMQCAECGSKYRRVTWSKNGTKKVVWRCVSRLDYGRNYCKSSPTITDEEIKLVIVRAIRKFNEDDHDYFITLMKATIGEAIGLGGGSDEIDLLNRRIDSLNRKMITMVNESIESGKGIDDRDEDFQAIASEIEQLKNRIKAIEEAVISDKFAENKLEMLQYILDDQKGHLDQYDDSIVRQIIECVKVHQDKVEVIFGGGIMIEEGVNTL